jgi:POT family proton-dependent oligopeptide transporter
VRARHPLGLYILFLTELWERFGFYCMLAIFKLYMTDKSNGHPFLQEHSNQIYGVYLGGVYFTPFFGGILAEWKWGYRLTIILGALFLGAGYLLLGVDSLTVFAIGLGAIIVGNGLFKPNISTMVGKLYPAGDPRVDNAFTIFYMGINIGAFTSPLVAGFLAARYGYQVGFMTAGAGMAISLVLFLIGQRWVVEAEQPKPAGVATGSSDVDTALQRRRNLALLLFFGINILFWMAFKQNGNTLSIWARDCTDRVPPTWLADLFRSLGLSATLIDKEGRIPAAYQASINPFFVIVLSPVLVLVWGRLRAVGLEPPTPAKLVLGFLMTVFAFIIMALAGLGGGDQALAAVNAGKESSPWLMSPMVLFAGYAVLTVGELCLSPMGLSLVSKLAAPRTRAVWMGGFFVSTALGGYLSGAVGYFWDLWKVPSRFFFLLAGSSLFAMLLMLAAYRIIASALPRKK